MRDIHENSQDSDNPPDAPSALAFVRSQVDIAWASLTALSDVLRRCLVPIVAAALMVGLLYLPQSQEFLDGLLLVCGSNRDACTLPFGVRATAIQFLVFELLAFLFAVVVWYSARVLASGRVDLPNASRITLYFERWIPRVAGAAPLCVMSIALLEPFGSWLSLPELIAGLVCASLLVLTPIFLHVNFRVAFGRGKMIWSVALGVFSVILCTIQLVPNSSGGVLAASWMLLLGWYSYVAWRLVGKRIRLIILIGIFEAIIGLMLIKAWQVGAIAAAGAHMTWTVPVTMLLPAGFLVLVLFRRDFGWHLLGQEMFLRMRQRLSFNQKPISIAPQFQQQSVLLLLFALAIGVAAYCAVVWDTDISAHLLFAPAAVVLWLLLSFLAILVFLFVVPLHLRFLSLAVLLAITYFGGVPPSKLLEAESEVPPNMCNDRVGVCSPREAVSKQYMAWQELHGGTTDNQPIILVAAAGGGARAAAHTSTMLAAVDAATCGHFGDRIFAISAVSGGALGAAAYGASREDFSFLHGSQRECVTKYPGRDRPSPLVSTLTTLTSSDHLSSSLIRALFRDLPLSFLPSLIRPDDGDFNDYRSRAGALHGVWRRDYLALYKKDRARFNLEAQVETALTRNVPSPGGVDGRRPLMLFNATSVQDGRRVVMGSPLLCPLDGYCATHPGYLLENAIDSARFPLLSPPRNRDVYGWKVGGHDAFLTQLSLVDGGYADNSGILTMLDVIDGLLAANVKPERIFAIIITSDPSQDQPRTAVVNYADLGLLAQVLAPVHAVVNSRDGHSERALLDLHSRLAKQNIIYWELGKLSRNQIDAESKARLQKLPEVEMMERLHGKHPERPLRNPALGWALSQESAEVIWAKTRAREAVYAEPMNYIYEYEKRLALLLKDGEAKH